MEVKKFSKVGKYHDIHHVQNQDYICSLNNSQFFAIMLADGASGCKKSFEGARLACSAVAEIIDKYGKELFTFEEDKISYLLSEHILYWIESHKKEEEDITEYGSTFSLFLLDKNNNRTLSLNIGDSAILSINSKTIKYVLEPRRYWGNPCLTTTKEVKECIEVKFGNLKLGDSIIVCSDGMLKELFGHYEIKENLMTRNILNVNSILNRCNNMDDCSYISLMN